MENSNKDPGMGMRDPNTLALDSAGGVHEAPADALSLDPVSLESAMVAPEPVEPPLRRLLHLARRADVILGLLLVVGAIIALLAITNHEKQKDNTSANQSPSTAYENIRLPLDDLNLQGSLSLVGPTNVTINGELQVKESISLTPSLQPTGAKAGQIYFDQGTNQLAYYNGSGFVFLTSPSAEQGNIQTLTGVQSIAGATGEFSLGPGLSLSGGQMANSGVLSVMGQTGNVALTAGPGIVLNGTNFSNSGVISISAGSPAISVSDDGNGNVTIDVASLPGSGTVSSSGGTAGRVPLFTGAQNIEDSIITQSGLTVTINGDLSVVTGGLTLSNALTVSNGGTGANSLATNGILVGNGTAAISSVAAGGAGLCLLSTSGAPAWGVCPSAAAVTSLNGLTGALSIANASAAGSTVTIDDASTTTKGIASFNATNFTASGGAVNTIQNINTGATPTFAGVNTNNITPSAALTVGISAQTALLQGSTTTITSNGVGNNIVLNSAASIELQDSTNVTGNVAASGDLAVNGGDLTSTGALNITPGGALTIGASSQALTLQGGASTSFRATSGANTTVVAFTSPTANTTLNFPALAAGTYTVCTTSGNCSGAAATLQSTYDNSTNPEIVLDATRGAMTIRDASAALGANLLEVQNNAGSITYLAVTASGAAVTGTLTASGNVNSTSGGVQTNGTTRVDNSGNLVNIAAITASGNATMQGGMATLGTNSQAGSIVLNDGSSNTGTLQVAALGQNTLYTLPDPGTGTATICLATGNCASSGGGVTTGGGATNRIAKFTGSQALGDSSITDDGTNVTVTVDVIIQGGDLTMGTAAQRGSILLHDGNGQTTALQAGDSAGNLTFILPTNTGSANQCLKQSGTGNQLVWQDCDGGLGGTSATLQTAYGNSTNPEITLNSSVGGLTIRDNSTPLGTNLFEIQNNAGSTTYLAVTVSGVSVTGAASATGNINSSGGTIQTNGTSRIDNSGNLVSIGNITGSGAMTIASVGAGSDITINGADQFIVQDVAIFNAASTFNASISIGANNITGTTGNIDLTNFDVVGSTGNVTAGTYNGQTISNAANFTGTVAIAGNTTLTGDVAVNGGDITSSGALNITPAGTLTVGATGQQLILQGSANTQLTATGGGFTTTVGFAGSPTGAVAYNFDRAAAAGTYTICTSVGNCVGSGGGVTTAGGTTGTLPKFTGAQALGDSLLSESGSTMTVNGNLNLVTGNQFRVNGVQISSANLSNDANLAKLGSSQTFTGNTVAFQNGTNSTNAFNVQNQAGGRVLTVDTTGGQVLLGVGSVLDGKLVFSNVGNSNTVTILPGTPTANRTLTLPNASGVLCTDSGNCAGAGATLQTSYNFSVGGTTPKIKVNSTLMGVDIQDADTTIGANLFNIRASNGSGLGNVMFGISSTGQVTAQNASNSTTAFRLLTQGGTSVLTGDTQNGAVRLGQSGTLDGTLVFANAAGANAVTITAPAATSARAISFGDESGTVCLRSASNCGFAVSSGSGNYIQNQNASQQASSNFWLSGTGRADTSFLAPLYDTATAVALNIGTTNATAINLNQNVVIGSGKTLTVNGTATFNAGLDITTNNITGTTGGIDLSNFDVTGSNGNVSTNGGLSVNGSTTLGDSITNDMLTISAVLQGGLVFEGSSADANEMTFAITNPTADRTITFGDETGTVCLQGSTNCNFAPVSGSANYIQNGTTAQASNFYVQAATSGSIAAIIRANAAGSGAILNLRNGADVNVATVSSTGAALFKNSTDSVNGFSVQNVNSDVLFNVDTQNSRVGIGTNTPGRTLDIALNNSTTTAPALRINQTGTGDASIEVANASSKYFVGLDATDNKFKISSQVASGSAIDVGDKVIGLTTDSGNDGLVIGSQFTTPASTGSLNSVSMYIVNAAGNLKMGIYADNGSDSPGTLVATSGEVALTTSSSWYTIPISGSVSASTKYWVMYRLSNSSASFKLNNGANKSSWKTTTYAAAWPDPYGSPTSTSNTSNWALYFTYTPTGTVDSFNSNLMAISETGQTTFKNYSNSVNAFQVQNAAGSSLFTVDTTGSQVVLGQASASAGKVTFQNAANANTASIQSGVTSTSYTLTLPTAVGGTGDCLKASDNAGALTFGACAGGGGGLSATPTTTGTNTVQPATSGVVAMTLNGTNTGTAAQALIVNQAGTNADAVNVNLTNTSGTQTNALLINRNGASGTTTNGINITNTAGTLTNGISFSGTIGVDIYRSAGTLLLQGGNGSAAGVGTAISMVAGNGGTSVNTTAGAGGATGLTSGNGGNASGSGTGGAGGNFTITAGPGGSSSTGNGGNGGVITLQPGTGGAGGASNGTTGRVQVGSSTTNATANVFALDSSNIATETGNFDAGQNVNGAMYYNTSMGKFRCYEGSWKDCIQTGGASGTLQAAYTASTGSTTPEIKLDTTRTTLDIQNADSALTNNLFAVRASNGSGLGNLLFNVYSSGRVGINMGTTSTNPAYDLTFGNGSSRTIGVANAASGAGNSISMQGGTAGSVGASNGSALVTGGGSTGASFSAGGGTSNATDDVGGNAVMQGGIGGGSISAYGGMYDASSGLQDGGSIQLTPGAGASGGFDGAVIVEPVANSMSTFIVRQSNDTTVMRIDTLVPRVTLGAIALDDTGALLVLDGKTGSSDPAGALGAMYYNIGQGKFRCYEKSMWRDCMATARSEYHYIHEMIGTTTENNGGFYSTLGGLFLGGVVSGATGHPGIVQLSTGTTSAAGAAGFGANDTGASFLLGGGDYYKHEALIRIPTLPTSGQNAVIRSGLYDGSSSGDGTDGCFFRYTNGTNSNRWQAICENNGTQSVCNSTSTPAANTWYRLTVEVDSTGSAADFYVNGTNICTVNSQIPTTAGRNVSTNVTAIKTVGTGTAVTMDVDYVETLIQFGALR